MPRRVEDYRGLTQLSRLRLLHAIQVRPDRTLNELVEATRLHPNTIREHLQILEDEGIITSATAHRGTRGRPPVVYRAVVAAADSAAAERRIRLSIEHGDLLRRIAPDLDHTAELGEDAVHQLDALYEHLEDAGFQPDLDEESLRVDLVPCPYLTDDGEERQLVCGVHQQLILDLLQQVPGPVEVRDLRPFAAPDRCTIHLQLSSGAASE